MRRVSLIIVALLAAFSSSAFAMSQPRYITHTGSITSSPITINTQALAQQNDLMVLACANQGGATLTPQSITGGWTTPSCSGAPAGTLLVTRTVSASEPATVGATFTGSSNTECILGYQRNTDGTVPVLDGCAWTTSGTVASVTTTQANDSLSYISAGSFNLTAFAPFANSMTEGQVNINMSWVYGGQGASGASITPLFTFGGGGEIGIVTMAFKSQTTTAVNFIGVGTEGFNGSALNNVSPTTATNTLASSVSIAQISELNGSTAIAITPPNDIVPRYAPTFATGAGQQTFTIDARSVPGDFFTVTMANGAVMTAPAACGAHAWSLIASVNTFVGTWGKILDSCDPGHSYSWTGFSGGVNQLLIDWVSNSGATLSADAGSACSSISSTANPVVPAITLATANESAFSLVFGQSSATTPVPPTTDITMWQNNGSASAGGWYSHAASGSSGTQAYTTPGSAQVFLSCHIAIRGAGTASPWTAVPNCSQADPTGNNQVNAFWALGLPQNTAQWFTFASNPSKSAGRIYNFNNLNTTTPVDVCTTLSNAGGMANKMAPTLTPTTTDDAILRLFPASTSNLVNGNSTGWANILAASPNANGPSGTLDSIDQAVAALATNNNDGGVYGSLSLALNDATGQTELANAITNQVALEVFAPTLPVVTSSGSFELIY